LDTYLAALKAQRDQFEKNKPGLMAMEGMEDMLQQASDFPKKAWASLKKDNKLPPAFANQPTAAALTARAAPYPMCA
jgi:hypothetical protein